MNNKCEICGGTVIINTDTGIGICDSCGNTTEIDKEILTKYRNLVSTADRKMMYNSVKYFTEAKAILEDIPFVDGVKEKIAVCDKRISEINSKEKSAVKQVQKEKSDNSKVGIIIMICVIVGLVLLVAAIGFAIVKIAKGGMSSGTICVLSAAVIIAVVALVAGKVKGN